MTAADFHLPVQLDYLAIFAWALTGAIVGLRKRFDLVGVFVTALLTSIGGGIVRDGVMLQHTPAVLTDSFYLPLIVIATALVVVFRGQLHSPRRVERLVGMIDAVATPAYAVVGMEMALKAGIHVLGVMLIGCISGVGGGILRDVVVREEPEVLKPGYFLAIPLAIACAIFLTLILGLHTPPTPTAWATVVGYFVVRVLTLQFNWRTRALLPN